MSTAASKRWQRRDRPWRSTLRGIVVAGPNEVVELERAAAKVWRFLEVPMSRTELAAAFTTMGAMAELEESDPLARLVEHDLIYEVP